MSTYYRFGCVSHDPPVVSESDGINHGDKILVGLLANRDSFLEADVLYEDVRDPGTYANVAPHIRFLNDHPLCRVWITNEYGTWMSPSGLEHREARDLVGSIGYPTGRCVCGAPWPPAQPWEGCHG